MKVNSNHRIELDVKEIEEIIKSHMKSQGYKITTEIHFNYSQGEYGDYLDTVKFEAKKVET